MTQDRVNIEPEGPSIALSRINKINTYEVQEMELDKLDAAVSTETSSLAFSTFMGGVLATALLGWLSAGNLSPTASAIYVATMLTSGVLSLWFGLSWKRARRERPRLLQTIKQRADSRVGDGKVLPIK